MAERDGEFNIIILTRRTILFKRRSYPFSIEMMIKGNKVSNSKIDGYVDWWIDRFRQIEGYIDENMDKKNYLVPEEELPL